MKGSIFIFLTFMCSLIVSGSTITPSEIVENRVTIANNLSNQQVTSIAEDALGHIWIGTIRGLNKYNVFEYQQYFNTNDSLSVSDNRINQIYKDSKNQLWIATINGICKYNDQDCFDQVPIESSSQNAIYLFENHDGKLFLNLNFAIYVYNAETNAFEPAIKDIGLNNLYTFCFIDKSNQLWIVKPFELLCYNTNTYELKATYTFDRQVTFAYLDESDDLWLSSWNQINIFDTKTNQYIKVPDEIANHKLLPKSIIVRMYPYNSSSTLIQTQNDGIFLYNHINGSIVHQSENGFPFEVPDVEITTFFTDSQKNLWIGSFDHGYFTRYNYKKQFNSNSFLNSKLEGKSVIAIANDKNSNLWMVTRSNGLIIYNNQTHKFKNISNSDLFSFRKTHFLHKATKLMVDKDNNIWILSNWILLRTRFENGEVVIKKWYYFPSGIMSITQDHKGTIWLGGLNENIYTLRQGESEFQPFHLYGKEFNFTPTMITLSTGKILIASFDKELQLIDPDTWKVATVPIRHLITNFKFVPVHLFEDSEGVVWIGTVKSGLFRYDPGQNKVEAIKGPACSDITSITEDVSGNIWVGTLYGLSKYDRTTNNFLNYYKTDGIGGNQFNEQSVCRMPDNSLIFGGTHGITYFNPIDIGYKRTVPLLFENLKIHNKLMSPLSTNVIDKILAYNPEINLNYDQNSFTISFTAIDYSEYERIKYAYKLEGFDNIWIEANKNHQAYYSNIPAGKYTFKVKLYNDENTVTPTEKAISVRIKPAPWFSWPAILFYMIIIYGVGYLFYRNLKRIKINKDKALQAEREREQEHKVNKMNMSFFSNLSHEFRTPLTMISGPVSILAADKWSNPESKKLLYIIQRNVNRMLRLVNQLMDFNKLENDTLKLKVKLTDIIQELNQLIEVFTQNANEKGIELSTYGLEDNFVMWLDGDKLDKIMSNLISNALKFTKSDGEIKISFDIITREAAEELFKIPEENKGMQFVKIKVSDTGKGIPEDKLDKVFERYYQLDNQTREFYNWGTGIGLYYSRCLVELHHGFIKAGNRTEGGAEFTFIIPVDDFVYSEEERSDEDNDPQGYIRTIEKEKQKDTDDSLENEALKPKLLIIDDDTEIIHYLKSILSSQYDITYKFDAESGYSSLKQVEPDLILCDVVMPGTDGYAFTTRVKENPSYCHIPIILVTAKATVENQVEGLNTGADAYVTKPFDPTYLVALINSQLKNRKTIQSLLGSTTKTDKIEANILAPHDNTFMTNLYDLMEKELSNSELNVNRITEVLKISRTKFYYKVKGLTGENPNVFFKTYKLNRAAELILEGHHNISEIADITGFSTPSHFSVSFKKQFGVSPSDYHKMS